MLLVTFRAVRLIVPTAIGAAAFYLTARALRINALRELMSREK